jgi:hypothetical protein
VRGKCFSGKKNSTTPKGLGFRVKKIPLIPHMYLFRIRRFRTKVGIMYEGIHHILGVDSVVCITDVHGLWCRFYFLL